LPVSPEKTQWRYPKMNPEQKKGRPQASLSTENRIIRFFARGWTYGRIASKVGVSTSTVWSIVHREPTARRRHDPRLATRVRTWLAHDRSEEHTSELQSR